MATERDWIAIAKSATDLVFFIEVNPVARMSFTNSVEGETSFWDSWSFNLEGEIESSLVINRDWEHSTVRSFLNGPYITTLPEWAVDRLVPIKVLENEKELLDKVVLLSEGEIAEFLARAPRSYQDVKTLDALKKAMEAETPIGSPEPSESEYEYDYEDRYEYDDRGYDDDDWEPRDPISRWKEDPRQYSKDGYEEWMNGYDSALQAQKDWLWMQSLADEYESQERSAKKDEARRLAEDRDRRSLFDAGCEWTREGYKSFVYGSYFLYETASRTAIRPVVCLDLNLNKYGKENQVATINDSIRLLPVLSDSELDVLISLPEKDVDPIELYARAVRSQEENTPSSAYDDDDIPF